MDRQHIISFVNQLFEDVPKSKLVFEQKEELGSHMEERVADYMADGLSFEDAFRKAKDDLGDVGELVKEFDKKGSSKKKKKRKKYRSKRFPYIFTPLSPFIYILLGFMIPGWHVWAVGWIIIPMTPIIETAISSKSMTVLVGLIPFIYVGLGILLMDWRFWAFGWVIIPIAGIVFSRPWSSLRHDNDDNDDVVVEVNSTETEPIIDDRKN